MPPKIITARAKNLNAATLSALFLVFLWFARPYSSRVLLAFAGLVALWAAYEWVSWFRTRRRLGVTNVMTLGDAFFNAFRDKGSSFLFLSIIFLLPCFVFIGVALSGLRGALMGLGFGLTYVACTLTMEISGLG